MSTHKIQELEELISNKERQLSRAEQESGIWNSAKHKHLPKAKESTIYVNSLRKEISSLYEELQKLK